MAARSPRVVVLGNVNMDLHVRVPHLPREGETLVGSDLRLLPGGKGGNQAVAAARLGAVVTLIACLGEDENGRRLARGLRRERVSLRHVRRSPRSHTGTAIVAVDPSGRNSILTVLGANDTLRPADVERAAPVLRSADVALAQLGVPAEAVDALLGLCGRLSLPCILDLSPLRGPLPARWRRAAVLSPNRAELAHLAGHEIRGGGDLREACRSLLGSSVEAVVVKLGERGAFVYRDGAGCSVPAVPGLRVVDTTGAGDAFTAALAVRWLRSHDLLEAVRFATCAGGLASMARGAQPSMPRRSAVEALYRRVAA